MDTLLRKMFSASTFLYVRLHLKGQLVKQCARLCSVLPRQSRKEQYHFLKAKAGPYIK
jgi:hypothetical protein